MPVSPPTALALPDTFATCGRGNIPGMVWRPGDPLKHLGPQEGLLHRGTRSPLFETRCGLGQPDGPWKYAEWTQNDDLWCPGCLRRAGVQHVEEPMTGPPDPT